MRDEIVGLSKHMRVSDEEMSFLEHYDETLNVMESARRSGLDPVNIHRKLKSNTPFAKLFRRLTNMIDKDPRYNKIGSLSMLLDLKKKAEEKEDYNLSFKIIQEINKMISGNIAATKKTVENVDIKIGGVIDLTKPIEEKRTMNLDYEDVDYEDMDYEED